MSTERRPEAAAIAGQNAPRSDPLRVFPSKSWDWEITSPERVGFDSERLRAMDEHIASRPEANLHCVLVVRRGMLAHEAYFSGEDVAWGRPLGQVRFEPETRHDQRSITKCVVSLLTGIAIDLKMIASTEEPIFQFLPNYADLLTLEKRHLLVRHLLTMSAGLEWDQNILYTDPTNSEIQMLRSPDPRRFVLDAPIVSPAGTWRFNGGLTEVMSAVLEQVTGRKIDDFAQEYLFEPMGISDFEWIRYKQTGVPVASSGLRLRPRDMAKLGQLLLQHGAWNGVQIVSSQWIRASISPQISGEIEGQVALEVGTSQGVDDVDGSGPPIETAFYGYYWWVGRSLVQSREVSWAAGVGLGGQRIFVVPALDIVVVMTGGCYSTKRIIKPHEILNNYVLAAAQVQREV